jgi:hypothetical protein
MERVYILPRDTTIANWCVNEFWSGKYLVSLATSASATHRLPDIPEPMMSAYDDPTTIGKSVFPTRS